MVVKDTFEAIVKQKHERMMVISEGKARPATKNEVKNSQAYLLFYRMLRETVTSSSYEETPSSSETSSESSSSSE
jgi:hypothetical protein